MARRPMTSSMHSIQFLQNLLVPYNLRLVNWNLSTNIHTQNDTKIRCSIWQDNALLPLMSTISSFCYHCKQKLRTNIQTVGGLRYIMYSINIIATFEYANIYTNQSPYGIHIFKQICLWWKHEAFSCHESPCLYIPFTYIHWFLCILSDDQFVKSHIVMRLLCIENDSVIPAWDILLISIYVSMKL